MAISKKLPVHAIKKLDMYFQLAKSVLTKERQDQLKKLNSNVRGLCNAPCTHGECVRACVRACVRVCVRACVHALKLL